MPRDLPLGDRIRRLRGFLGLQQKSLAATAKIESSKLNRIERGLTPHEEDVRKIADAFGTTVRALRGEAD